MSDFFEKNARFARPRSARTAPNGEFHRGFPRIRGAWRSDARSQGSASQAPRRPFFARITLLTAAVGPLALPGPQTEVLRIPVSADTWISSAGRENEGNNGGSERLKLKSCQELTLLDLDPSALSGRVILQAQLHVQVRGPSPILRASVSSVASRWNEGRGRGYERESGASSFRWAETGRRPWGEPGGDVTDVILGAGHTRWSSHDATPPDANGWQSLEVDPAVVACRVAGLSHGFALFDDIGSEYTREGERFAYHPFPNRFLASRESGPDSAPYFTVVLGERDVEPPGAVLGLRLAQEGRELEWTVPSDVGPAGTLGFCVRFSSDETFEWDTAREVPQRLVALAGAVGSRAFASLRGLGLAPDEDVTFGVVALDAAGQRGPLRTVRARLPARVPAPGLVREDEPLARVRDAPRALGALAVAFRSTQGDVDTTSREPLASDESVLTQSGLRGEWLDFLVLLRGPLESFELEARFDDPSWRPRLALGRSVSTESGRCADPLEPWDGRSAIVRADPADTTVVVHVEVFVPRDAAPGIRSGRLRFQSGDESLEVPLTVLVLDLELPSQLSFVPEMNAYDLAPPPTERAWYALAHEHRVNLNVLRYDWKGRVHAGCAPLLLDGAFDWSAFDARFGPLLDARAFADGTRPGVPVENFYLPWNENWPVELEPHFAGGYWADRALDEEYWRAFAKSARALADHVQERGWRDTRFQFCLNDKIYHKGTSWSGSSAPWILDEPTHGQDFFALACFGRAFWRGVEPSGVDNVLFRVDLSRPQWAREWLDGLAGVRVVGSAFSAYRERVLDTKARFQEQLYLYATTNAPGTPNTMAVAWCLDAWCDGADGVIPWQTIGRESSWSRADPLALLYPPRAGAGAPVPSLRLKAFRRGQQDVELLELWRRRLGLPREAVAARVREIVDLGSNARARFEDDAGELVYPRVTPEALARLRAAAARALVPPR